MSWLLWIALSNIGIVVVENVYRSGKYDSFISALPYVCVPMVIAQAGLFYGFRGAPNLMFAGSVFTLMNVCLRICNSYYLGEHLNLYNWAGVVLLCISTILLKLK